MQSHVEFGLGTRLPALNAPMIFEIGRDQISVQPIPETERFEITVAFK
jgi:hypothetical protein